MSSEDNNIFSNCNNNYYNNDNSEQQQQEQEKEEEEEESWESEVILNVYDLTPHNNYTIFFGFGIFHSGIQVHGKEYGFGAHEFPLSGIFEVEPRSCPGFVYRCSISLGHIKMSPSVFRSYIETVASEYHGDTYHLLSKNCNHFTDDLSLRLTGKPIPGWVNRLAGVGSLCSCLLPDSLQMTAVKQLPEYHECSEEEGFGSLESTTPYNSTEVDDTEQEKHLLSLSAGNKEVAFVKEADTPAVKSETELSS